MSEFREIKVDYNLEVLKRVATKAGWDVRTNSRVRAYGNRDLVDRETGEVVVCPLVIRQRNSGYAIGFKVGPDGNVVAVMDNYQDKAQKSLDEIRPRYQETMVKERSVSVGYQEVLRNETDNEIILRLRRAT